MKLEYKYIVAITYTVALFLDRLDLTIVNITLPTLAKIFNIPLTSTDWVSLSFLLALAISIPISCWLGEQYGYKKIYILSMLLFGIGSTLCAWAPNIETLIALRFIHGIGGGMLIPVGMTIIYRAFDKSEYASITSFTFLPSLLAPAIAPFLGGFLLDLWSWKAVFLISGPVCLALAVISFLLLKKDSIRNKSKLDWGGFILLSAILLDIFYTLSLFGKPGRLIQIIVGIIFVIILIYYFIQCEKKAPLPLIDLRYFLDGTFVKANLIQLCFQICHFGAIFLMGMYLQIGIGLSATMAGIIMGMQAIGAIATSRYSVRLFNIYGAKLPITIGFIGIAVLSPCVLFINGTHMIWFALILFFSRGIFSGLCGTPIQTLSIIDFDKEQMGPVNTIFNACRQIAISVGVAISSCLMEAGMYFANLNENTLVINTNDIFKVFGPGFLALPIVAIIGVAIVQSLKLFPQIKRNVTC